MNIKKEIIEKYKLGGNNNIRTLSREYKVRRQFIKNILIDANIKIRSSKEAKNEQIKTGHFVGKDHPRYGKPSPIGSGHCRWYYYNGKKYQGTWEFMFGLWLEQEKIKFNVHENVKQFRCKFEDNKDFTYCPDFYLTDYDKYVEIKGYFDEKSKKRLSLFKQQYLNTDVTIIDKNKLMEIGAFDIQKKVGIDLELYQLDYKNDVSVKRFIEEVDKIEFIKSFIIDGLNLSELAQKYDTTYRIISHVYNLWVPKYATDEYYQFILTHCKNDIIKDCQLGYSKKQLINKYHFRKHKHLFDEYLNNLNCHIKQIKRQFIKKEIPENIENNILCDYKQGYSKKALVKKYNIRKIYINRILNKHSIESRSVSYYTKRHNEQNRNNVISGRQQQIINDYLNNLSIKSISKKYNIKTYIIKRLLIDNNIEIRKTAICKYNVINKDIADKIINDYKSGLNIRNIIIKYNITRKDINKLLLDKNITIRHAGDYAVIACQQRCIKKQQNVINEYTTSIISEYNNGYGIKLLARKYHVKQDIIKNIILNNGIKIRSKKELFNFKKQNRLKHDIEIVQNKEQIIKDYKLGQSIGNICVKYNIRRKIITKILINNNVEIRKAENYASIINKQKNLERRQTIINGKMNNIINDYMQGVAIAQLQQKYNISAYIIKRSLIDSNILQVDKMLKGL